jgi:spore coat protein U-like protein
MRPHRGSLAIIFGMGLVALVAPAIAATMATSFEVSASVEPNCRIAVSEGSRDALVAPRASLDSSFEAVATLTITCTRGTVANVQTPRVSRGAAGTGTGRSPSEVQHVSHHPFGASSRSATRDANDTGVRVVRTRGARVPRRFALYRQALSRRSAMAGSPLETVTATLNF